MHTALFDHLLVKQSSAETLTETFHLTNWVICIPEDKSLAKTVALYVFPVTEISSKI